MALEFRTPPPRAPREGEDLHVYLSRLVTWLRQQAVPEEERYEELLGMGGALVANRMFGFEGVVTVSALPQTSTLLTAPVSPKKKIITSLDISTEGDKIEASVGVLKGATFIGRDIQNYEAIAFLAAGLGSIEQRSYHHFPWIVLDAADESLVLRVFATTTDVPPFDMSYMGSYLDVD